MKYLALAVLLAVLQTPPSVPRPSNPHDNNPAHATRQADGTASQTVVVANQRAPNRDENRSTTPPEGYFKRLSSPEILPQVILCAVGIAGVIIATCTLGKIATQAREMRHQRIVMRGQLGTMRRQLREMQAAGEQTAKLIEQAAKQVTEL